MCSSFKLIFKIKILLQGPLFQEVQLRLVATGRHFYFFSFIPSILPDLSGIILISRDVCGQPGQSTTQVRVSEEAVMPCIAWVCFVGASSSGGQKSDQL